MEKNPHLNIFFKNAFVFWYVLPKKEDRYTDIKACFL